MALTDKMQKCNPKPISIRTKSKHTKPARATRFIEASIVANNDNPITVQLLPKFDDCAKLIVTSAINTVQVKRVAFK